MGHCEDISTLPNFEPTDQYFLFTDIQQGKGKAWPVGKVKMVVDGTEETAQLQDHPMGWCEGLWNIRCELHLRGFY